MNFPFFIAKRYLFSKKTNNVVNIITKIAITGVAVGCMALMVVLSAFNGIERLVVSLFNSFDPPLKVFPSAGKSFSSLDPRISDIKKLQEVAYYSDVIEDNALLKFRENQHIGIIKGVDKSYRNLTRLDTMLVEGTFFDKMSYDADFGVLGQGVALSLAISLANYVNPIEVYVPRREAAVSTSPDQAFKSLPLYPSGVFSIQHEFDTRYTLVPIEFARELFEMEDQISAVELSLRKGGKVAAVKEKMQEILGNDFVVKDRLQQHDSLYRIMKSEKLAVFIILTFILIIATFNVVGSVTMLIIDKSDDIKILRNLGAENRDIVRIFFIEGLLVSLMGCIIGLASGLLLCVLQQQFGLIPIEGSFVMSTYPIDVEAGDFLKIFLTVVLIGSVASYIPSRIAAKKYRLLS